MIRLFRLPAAAVADPAVDAWFARRPPALAALVAPWFQAMRACGDDVRALVHDDQPTACVGDVAFAYVAAYTGHAAVGFFVGSALADPAGLLCGNGRHMRHVKLRPGVAIDEPALQALVVSAYTRVREAALTSSATPAG